MIYLRHLDFHGQMMLTSCPGFLGRVKFRLINCISRAQCPLVFRHLRALIRTTNRLNRCGIKIHRLDWDILLRMSCKAASKSWNCLSLFFIEADFNVPPRFSHHPKPYLFNFCVSYMYSQVPSGGARETCGKIQIIFRSLQQICAIPSHPNRECF